MNSPLVASLNGASFSGDLRLDPIGRRSLVAGQYRGRQAGGGVGAKSAGSTTPHVSGTDFLSPKPQNFSAAEKACSKCAASKPRTLEFFPSDARRQDGLRAECRVCFSAVRLERYARLKGDAYSPAHEQRKPKPRRGGYVAQDLSAARKHSRGRSDRTADRLRDRIRRALGPVPKGHYSLGCSPSQLRLHIERQFSKGMTWANRSEWHIDHIRPLASFDLTDPVQIKLACHFTNLRPIWAADNLRKGAKLEVLL